MKVRAKLTLLAMPLVVLITAAACNKDNDKTGEASGAFDLFYNDVNAYESGDYIIIESNGVPDHTSPYWSTSDNLYENYNSVAFMQNPNSIEEQDLVFKIPANPTEASDHEATPMGAIGVALNGVPLFNQYAAGRTTLDDEIISFDQWNGHPQQTGQYHYHLEPTWLTQTFGEEALMGFLLDGFPVYGPVENGVKVTNDDLDAYHGHSHVTDEYPEGIYHYHITDEAPYINGDGFYGNAGSVSN